jgi:hypothetical protein
MTLIIQKPTGAKLAMRKDGVAATDTNIRDVSLLLHGNGTNGSTTITDSSLTPKTVTANGNAQISTVQSKFGGASIAFDGTGDYLTIPNGSDFSFGADELTIECFVFCNTVTGTFNIYSQRAAGTNGITWRIGNGTLQFFYDNAGSGSINTSGGSVTINTWHHLALTRQGNVFKLWINGSLGATSIAITASVTSSQAPVIGGIGSNPTSENFNGYIDELRITKNVCRYTANFTPPTLPFPDF